MIRINKPENGPKIPYNQKGNKDCKLKTYTQRVKDEFVQDNSKFTSKTKAWRPTHKIYGHQIIKNKLKKDVQHNKCCYCEKEILSGYTVEHFRPCGGYQEVKGGTVMKPGYYWLAYEWSNLFYSCNDCNRKKNAFFPLRNDRNRARNHKLDENCLSEEPILIDLVNENPKDFIEYRFVEPFGTVENFQRGELMIDAIGLRSEDMFDERISHWSKMKKLKDSMEQKLKKLDGENRQDEIDWYNSYLDEKCNPEYPFSSLISDNRDYFELNI